MNHAFRSPPVSPARPDRFALGIFTPLLLLTVVPPATAMADRHEDRSTSIRIATFNVSLYGDEQGSIAERLRDRNDEQINGLVSIVQAVRPDVLLINELDTDQVLRTADRLDPNSTDVDNSGDEPTAAADVSGISPTNADRLADRLAMAGDDLDGLEYRYRYAANSNTGVLSGMDIDGNGSRDDPEDAWGYGRFPGQYGMAILSRYPIEVESVRTFQNYRWSDLPGALKPTLPNGSDYYNDQIWKALRLSSKNHLDVPVKIVDRTLHVLASHPTPPVFDGADDHNGCRNHDEIAFWARYLENNPAIVDDSGVAGGLPAGESFVILGDLNSDPDRGDSRQAAIRALLDHPRTTPVAPAHDGGETTAAFRNGPMRVDYTIPSVDLVVENTGVYWPMGEPGASWVTASDHRLVWVDVKLPAK